MFPYFSIYSLVNLQFAIENGHRHSLFTHETLISIVMHTFTKGALGTSSSQRNNFYMFFSEGIP